MTVGSETPDPKIPGLYIRTWPSGKRSATLRYVVDGRQRRLSLGVLGPSLTLDAARKLAKVELGRVAAGHDPSRARHSARAAATFGEAAARWLAEHAVPKLKPRTVASYRTLIRVHLDPALGREKLAAIDRAVIESVHRRIGQTAPGAANRALRIASEILAWSLPPEATNPCKGVRPFRERGQQAGGLGKTFTGVELAKIDAALASDVFSSGVVAALRLLMLTGARLSEVTGLRWADVDLDHRQLVLGDTKTGRSVRPLTPPAVEYLRALRARGSSPTAYVCPTSTGGPQNDRNIGRAWESIRQRTGIVGRIHDLRHTAGSLALAAGVPLPMVSRMLGHKSVTTTARVYAHAMSDAMAADMERAGAAWDAALARGRAAISDTIGD